MLMGSLLIGTPAADQDWQKRLRSAERRLRAAERDYLRWRADNDCLQRTGIEPPVLPLAVRLGAIGAEPRTSCAGHWDAGCLSPTYVGVWVGPEAIPAWEAFVRDLLTRFPLEGGAVIAVRRFPDAGAYSITLEWYPAHRGAATARRLRRRVLDRLALWIDEWAMGGICRWRTVTPGRGWPWG
jgi:hypothetical protein